MDDWKRQAGFIIGRWQVLPLHGELRNESGVHHIEPKVMDVLVFLASRPGEVVEREAIIEAVWGGRFVSDDPLSKCITELRKVLGDSARHSEYIGTVHKRGYRLLKTVEPIPRLESDVAGKRRWWTGIVAVAAVVLIIAAVLQFRSTDEARQTLTETERDSARQTLAVLPFVIRSADSGDSFIGDGLHDDLLTQLARIEEFDVISRTSVERFRDTNEAMADIANSLNATLILEGGLQRNGQQVRINLQLIDPSGDLHVWANTYDRDLPAENLFDMQSELVQNIVSELASVLNAKAPVAPSETTVNFAAYSEFVKGRRLVRTESVTALNAAVNHFKSAIEIDPMYAEAHAALADAYLSLAYYFFGGMQPAEAIAAAEPLISRAIELNPDIAQAYVANAILHTMQNDSPATEEALITALRLQPSYPRAYRVYASYRWRLQQTDEAIRLAEHASSLDPLSGTIQLELGRYYEAVARYDDAMQNYLLAGNLLPENALVKLQIGALKYLVFGEVAESLIWYRRAAELDPESPSMQVTPAFAYLELGDLDRAELHVDRGMALDPNLFWVRLVRMNLNLRKGDRAAAVEDAETILAMRPRQWDALRMLRDRDLDSEKIDAALARYSELHPELTESDEPRVDRRNYPVAVDLALIYSRLGQQQKAMRLTGAALDVMASMPRLGFTGYWLTDVGALAIRGEHDKALDTLEAAIDSGYRLRLWYFLDIDKNFDALRELPRFGAIRDEVRAIIREEMEQAEKGSELFPEK